MRKTLIPILVFGMAAACKDTTGESPLVGLANRLYLEGDWAWTDSMQYWDYEMAGDGQLHHGWYVVVGTATLTQVDSTDEESYEMIATASLSHVDSVGSSEMELWTVPDIEFTDTVLVKNDSIFGLAVEPIPPEARPTTQRVAWVLDATKLWCTNWLTDSVRAGNTDGCETRVVWVRGTAPPVP